MTSVIYVLPEVFLGLSLAGLLVFGAVVGTQRVRTSEGPRERTRNGRALVGYTPNRSSPRRALSVWVLALVGRRIRSGPSNVRTAWVPQDVLGWSVRATLSYDSMTVRRKLLLVLASVAVRLARRSSVLRTRLTAFEYPLLRLLAVLGRLLLTSASDLRRFYLALELQSLALYALASFARGSAYSTEAGLKYFRLGAFASGLFLLGASLIYGFLGTTSYEDIGRLLAEPLPADVLAPVLTGWTCRVVALFFKLAVAPFHRWSPDVREGAPRSSTRFFAVVSKVATLAALIRWCTGPFVGLRITAGGLDRRALVSGTSRVVAAVAALAQRKWKRFLAYSAIGHIGYRLRGVSAGTVEGIAATLVYLTVYVLGSLTTWAVLSSVVRVTPETGGRRGVVYLTEVGGLAYAEPAVARALCVARFSRAGVPPRAGFLAKVGVFFAAREAGQVALAIVAISCSLVSAFFYLRVRKRRYFEGEPRRDARSEPRSWASSRVIACSTRRTRLLRVWPSVPRIRATRAALAVLSA